MFGTLRAPRPALDTGQQRLYRAHFCASCHAMHRFGGRASALLTNYDQTLLALLVSALWDDREGPERADLDADPLPCTAVPFLRVRVQHLPDEAAALLAAFNLALVGAKIEDDRQDRDGGLALRLVDGATRGLRTRAHAVLRAADFPVSLFERLASEQEVREQEAREQQTREQHVRDAAVPTGTDALRDLALPTAALLGQILAHTARLAGRWDRVGTLRALGEAIGRAVYVFDALDDLDRDRARGAFNALEAAAASPARALAEVTTATRTARGELGRLADLLGDRLVILTAVLDRLDDQARRRAADQRSSSWREVGECDCSCGDGACCGSCGPCGTEVDVSSDSAVVCGCCPCEACYPMAADERSPREDPRRTRGTADAGDDLVGREGIWLRGRRGVGQVRIDDLVFDAQAATWPLAVGDPVRVFEVAGGVVRVRKA